MDEKLKELVERTIELLIQSDPRTKPKIYKRCFSTQDIEQHYQDEAPIVSNFVKVAKQIVNLIKEAGYLPVEPVQLEVLGDEEIQETIISITGFYNPSWLKHHKPISRATNTHNESKGQLYRRKE